MLSQGKRIYIGYMRSLSTVINSTNRFCIYALSGHQSTIRCLKVLHGRPIAVTGSRDRTVRIWDVQRGKMLRVLEGHDQSVRCIDVCGNICVSGSYDATCRVWNVDTGECLHVLRGHYHQIYTVAFDGVRIASGGLDTTVRVWDAETGCVFSPYNPSHFHPKTTNIFVLRYTELVWPSSKATPPSSANYNSPQPCL